MAYRDTLVQHIKDAQDKLKADNLSKAKYDSDFNLFSATSRQQIQQAQAWGGVVVGALPSFYFSNNPRSEAVVNLNGANENGQKAINNKAWSEAKRIDIVEDEKLITTAQKALSSFDALSAADQNAIANQGTNADIATATAASNISIAQKAANDAQQLKKTIGYTIIFIGIIVAGIFIWKKLL